MAELLFTDIIDRLNKRLGPGTVRRASTINRPRPKREVQQIKIFNEFNRRNPKADGGPMDDYEHYVLKSELSEKVIQLMDEEGYEFGEAVKEAMRQGYKNGDRVVGKRKGDKVRGKKLKYSPAVLEKYAQYFFNKSYKDIPVGSEEYTKIWNAIRNAQGKFRAPMSKKGRRLTAAQEAKILQHFPDADFEKYGRMGFPKTTGTKDQFLKYTKVRDFKERGYKTKVSKSLPKAVQRAIMVKYENEVPKNFKWDFDKPNQKYGVPNSKYPILNKKITAFVNNPTPMHALWNYSTPEGWMMSVMQRNFMQYGDEFYEPLYDKINGKKTIVGWKDKTKYGKGKDYYYGKKRATQKKGLHIRQHVDFNNTKKFLSIAQKTNLAPNKAIQDILIKGGVDIDGRLKLNTLLNYLINEKGRTQTNRGLVLHHKSGIGPRATGDYQLLNRLVNARITGVEEKMRANPKNITQKDIDFLKKNKATVIIDGVAYGSGPKTAEAGLKQTEKFVQKGLAEKLKQDPELRGLKKHIVNVKKFAASNGFQLNSFAGAVDLSQAGIKLPPGVQDSLNKILNVGGKFLRGVGKAAVVLDPMFAAYDFSTAIDKGASGSDATEYMIKRFGEGVLNLPGLVIGGVDYLKDKAAGEEAKFETPYEFTFARDALEEDLAAMPKAQRLRNIANRDFDVGIGAGMRMVDDMDIPASRDEIEKERQKYLKSQLGPYYKYGIETLPRKVAKPNKYDIDT